MEGGTEEQAEFTVDQKSHGTGESRRLSRGDTTELGLDGMAACSRDGEEVGREFRTMGMA